MSSIQLRNAPQGFERTSAARKRAGSPEGPPHIMARGSAGLRRAPGEQFFGLSAWGRWVIISVALICGVFFLVPPVSQDESFHLFADNRILLGIPNFWNVVSNLPFLLVGIAGIRKAHHIRDRALFTGVLLTAFGSAYYHLQPDDAHLIWDRMPMTLIFMSFVCCVFENDRIVMPLMALGTGTVIWWWLTNDLRPYGFVKFGPILLTWPAFWKNRYIAAIVMLFAFAQLFELFDHPIYANFPLSGHTLKHLTAGLATYVMMLWRRPVSCTP